MKDLRFLSRAFIMATSLLTCGLNSALADIRIATVDVGRIMNEAPDALAKRKEIDTASEEAKKKIETKGKDLQALKTKLEGQKISPDSKEAESFRNQVKDFERLRADMKADLEKKYMKINKELSEKIMGKIESYAKANKYDLVIDKSEKFRGPVLYGADSADITNDILKDLR